MMMRGFSLCFVLMALACSTRASAESFPADQGIAPGEPGGQVAGVGHNGSVGAGGRQIAPTGSLNSLSSVLDTCGIPGGGGLGAGGGSAPATGGVASSVGGLAPTRAGGAPTPSGTPAPPAPLLGTNASINDITLFVQANCTFKCHNGTKAPSFTVTGTDAGTARIMNGSKPIKFRDAINAIRNKPAMADVAKNVPVMTSLENVANAQ